VITADGVATAIGISLNAVACIAGPATQARIATHMDDPYSPNETIAEKMVCNTLLFTSHLGVY
jgi:hypothetical protein